MQREDLAMQNLPLTPQTEISCYQFYVFPYAILYTLPEYRDYLAEHYLQCFGYVPDYISHINFGYADGVGYNDMFYDSGPLDIVFHSYALGFQLDIKQYIVSSIDSDSYIVVFVDEYYIEGRPSYQTNHRLHDMLIYGYDDENFNYFVFDRSPSFLSFPKNQLCDAYRFGRSTFMSSEEKVIWVDGKSIVSLKPKPMQSPYIFSVNRFARNLESYLNGEFSVSYSSFVIPKEKCHIGVYNTNLLKHYVDNTIKNAYITYPAVHAWYESKRNLLSKIKYCYDKANLENSKLISDYETEVRQQAERVRLSFLKYDRNGQLNRSGISPLLGGIVNSERSIVGSIYNELNHHIR